MAVLPSGSQCCTCEDEDPCNCGEEPEPCVTGTVYINGLVELLGIGTGLRSIGDGTGVPAELPPYEYTLSFGLTGSGSMGNQGTGSVGVVNGIFSQEYEYSPGGICENPSSPEPFDCIGSYFIADSETVVTDLACPTQVCTSGQLYQAISGNYGREDDLLDFQGTNCTFFDPNQIDSVDHIIDYWCLQNFYTWNEEVEFAFSITAGPSFEFGFSYQGYSSLSISFSTTQGATGVSCGSVTTNDYGTRTLYAHYPVQSGETSRSDISGNFDVYVDESIGIIDGNGDCVSL